MAHESEITYHEPCSQSRSRSCARVACAGGCDGAAGRRTRRSIVAREASHAPHRLAHRHRSPNLALRLSASAGTVDTGQQVTYTATVVNTGRRTDRNAGFRDLLPGKATLVSTSPSQGSCGGSRVIACNLGSLGRGASATITIVVTANRPGWMTDYAWVSTNPPGGWEHRHAVSTNVQGVSSNVGLKLTESPGSVDTGQQVTYTATVSNSGNGTAGKRRLPGSASGQGDPRLGEREPGELQRQPDDRVQPRVAERRRLGHGHDRGHGEPAGLDDRPRLGLEQPARKLAAPAHRLRLRPRRQPEPEPEAVRLPRSGRSGPAGDLHRDRLQLGERRGRQRRASRICCRGRRRSSRRPRARGAAAAARSSSATSGR